MIDKLIWNLHKYFAHTRKNEQEELEERELLKEHTERTEKYFNRIWTKKEIERFIDIFAEKMWGGITKETRKFWLDSIRHIPSFHDIGKINPEFQKQKMKNDCGEVSVRLSREINSEHSILSAVIYLDYYLKRIGKLPDKSERKNMRMMILVQSYIIARHHSGLCPLKEFLRDIQEENSKGMEIVEIIKDNSWHAYREEIKLSSGKLKLYIDEIQKICQSFTISQSIALYTYVRLLYSTLLASDYYATAEFMSGTEITELGEIREIRSWSEAFENTEVMKSVRQYQKQKYPLSQEKFSNEQNINILRTEMLLDAENELMKNTDQGIFYLEAPTGSGKSNTAINLSFQLIKSNPEFKKIYYIYPFNTLVEQNQESLNKIFGAYPEILEQIVVVNSLTPIKVKNEIEKHITVNEDEEKPNFQEALLDRQFLNYPMILSTHVSLFDTMFSDRKDSAFGFHQLMNNVIILDEIQSYKNKIWGEIAYFLKEFSLLLNIKIIIMSATLPDLDHLTGQSYAAIPLITDRSKYFLHSCFKNRVKINFDLIEYKGDELREKLQEYIVRDVKNGKKVLAEFIRKKSAEEFFAMLSREGILSCEIEYISGDDSIAERKRILNKIKNKKGAIVLVATQVVEAGVDIDMDTGYKDISKLDSEEQFLGRINRSCLRTGMVYFFNMDPVKQIYRDGDVRTDQHFTLENTEIREYLMNKDFPAFYGKVLDVIKKNLNNNTGEIGLDAFFKIVGNLDFKKTAEKMKLIEDDQWKISIFLERTIEDETGNLLDGKQIWTQYKMLLEDNQMEYAEKTVKLSEIRSLMSNFIYEVPRDMSLNGEQIGDLICIEDGEQYIENGKLVRDKLKNQGLIL